MTEMAGTIEATETPPLDPNPSFLDSEFRYILFPVVYSIIFIVGIFANIYVLFVLRCLRESRGMGEIRIYMTNLTIADLLFVSALPFWIGYYSRRGDWMYGDFMCRLTGSFFFINNYGTILFLGAISVNRYWAVSRPLDVACSNHRCRGITVCAIIWAFTLSVACIYLVSESTHFDPSSNVTRCFEGYQNETTHEKQVVAITHFVIIGMFFVVFFLVVVCNLLIARALLSQKPPTTQLRSASTMTRSDKKPRGVKRRALHLLVAVVGVFIVCFVPHHIVQGFWVLAVLQIKDGWGHVTWSKTTLQMLNDAHQITLVLMGLNCILDPVIYYFATKKFRKFIMAHIKRLAKGEGCSQSIPTQLSMDSKNVSQRLQSER